MVRCKYQISLLALCFYHHLWDFKQVAEFLFHIPSSLFITYLARLLYIK